MKPPKGQFVPFLKFVVVIAFAGQETLAPTILLAHVPKSRRVARISRATAVFKEASRSARNNRSQTGQPFTLHWQLLTHQSRCLLGHANARFRRAGAMNQGLC
jgi:hypothetical protein